MFFSIATDHKGKPFLKFNVDPGNPCIQALFSTIESQFQSLYAMWFFTAYRHPTAYLLAKGLR